MLPSYLCGIIAAIENDEDRDFAGQLFERHEKHLYRIAYEILHKREDAQDAVQDTALRMSENIQTFRNLSSELHMRNLLIKICRNAAINIYHKKKKDLKYCVSTTVYDDGLEDDELGVRDIPDNYSDVLKILVSEEDCQYLINLYNSVPDYFRDVMDLRVVHQMPFKEIGVLFNTTPENARMRCCRGRKFMMEKGGDRLAEILQGRGYSRG